LFKRFPRPDYCLGLHCDARHAVGHVSYAEGLLCANVDTVDITVFGKSGHGSAPHTTIDPVVIAARIVLDLQTLVSREVQPGEPARKTAAAFREVLGKNNVHEVPPTMGGEDFGRYGREGIPIFFFFVGTMAQERVAAAEAGGEPLPSLHSDKYYPVPEPSVRA